MPGFIDLSGQKYGFWKVIGRLRRRAGDTTTRWVCKCTKCGIIKVVQSGQLRGSHSTQCNSCARITHGASRGKKMSRTYAAWTSMRNRCTNPAHSSFPDYGGRGIKCCERWESFEAFLADMGECPHGLTLDRFPDNDGNYEPSNCRWATDQQQQNNRRCNHRVTFQGIARTVSEWSPIVGINKFTIFARLNNGWSPEEALTTPPLRR